MAARRACSPTSTPSPPTWTPVVAPLDARDWAGPTPAPGWTIAPPDRPPGLDRPGRAARRHRPGGVLRARLADSLGDDPEHYVDRGAAEFLAPPAELLARWRAGRAALADALRRRPPGRRSCRGTAPRCRRRRWPPPGSWRPGRTARTWPTRSASTRDPDRPAAAHRAPRLPYPRPRVPGPRPAGPDRAGPGRAVAPDGALWTFGPADAADRVTGPALDFCLLVTQRRHRADLALQATGPVADEWLDVAQAFAGPPGAGRAPAAAAS